MRENRFVVMGGFAALLAVVFLNPGPARPAAEEERADGAFI